MVARRRSRTGAVAVLLLAAAVLREAFVVPGGFAIGFDGKFPVFFSFVHGIWVNLITTEPWNHGFYREIIPKWLQDSG